MKPVYLWSVRTLVMVGAALALVSDLHELDCPLNTSKSQCWQLSSTSYRVNGSSVDFTYEIDNSLTVECSDILLPDPMRASRLVPRWLPHFKPTLRVVNVNLTSCRPADYATVFAALNVTLVTPFNLELNNTGQDEPLKAAHFDNLTHLDNLTLRHVAVLHGLPASLEGLTTLTMERMSLLSDTILEALPRTLTELRLNGVRIARVPAAVMNLPELRLLRVEFKDPAYWIMRTNEVVVERGNASRLQQLYVEGADGELLSEWVPPVLEEVILGHWQAVKLKPMPACAELVKLMVFHLKASELPPGWVARCPRLQVLNINGAFDLQELPSRLLENATQLTNISIRHTKLSSLPPQLFADTHNLAHINLRGNRLKKLPSALLTLPLLSLDLGYNGFNTSVAAELATFTELRSLSLAWNQEFGDICAVNDSNVPEHKKSSLVSLAKLEQLDLYSTGISVICSDWREDMVNLTFLDLSGTRIANLTYEDLQYKRNVPAEVKLSSTIYFSADDYDRAAAAAVVSPPSRDVTILLTTHVSYNCNLYWITEALNNGLLSLRDVQLGDRSSLGNVRPEKQLCPRSECGAVPADCYCGMAGGGLLRVICVGVELKQVPQLQSLSEDVDSVDLVLANNLITKLDHNDLPPNLRVLDLRNNSISYITETTARALVSGTNQRVLLAGNRLECSCRAKPALRVLRDHAATVLSEYNALRCKDGGTLEDAINNACPTSSPPTLPSASPISSAMWTVTLAAVLVSVGMTVLAVCLWWKWHNNFLGHTRALMWRLGWRSREERDAARAAWLSDAFVMFGRGDERPALEVTARLEHGPRPRRVSLAERDWLPPALLTECITLSARTARCTVALVSRECERSLETDEIHAVARRGALVLVLPPAGELEDAALGRYATDYPHMVLRRDTPDFWRRLERVVPVSPPTPASPPTPPSEYIPLVPLNTIPASPPTPPSEYIPLVPLNTIPASPPTPPSEYIPLVPLNTTPVSPPTPASPPTPPSEYIPLVPLTPHR